MSMPLIFVGSSAEQVAIVRKMIVDLEHVAVVRPWTRIFTPGETTLESLIAEANKVDFALFIFGPDDWTESREIGKASPRDNVVFEAGLFGGILGLQRSMILYDRAVKLPSDLLGLTPITYDAQDDPAHQSQIACAKIAEVIERKGWRGSEGLAGQMAGNWWQYTLSDGKGVEQSALSLVEIERHGQRVSLEGRAWTRDGALIAQFKSKAIALSEENRSLFYYWEGDWPGEADARQMFGKGEIVLDGAQQASGYFTARSDGPVDPRERKQVRYYRAGPGDLQTIEAGGDAARALIRAQLDKRAGQVFTAA